MTVFSAFGLIFLLVSPLAFAGRMDLGRRLIAMLAFGAVLSCSSKLTPASLSPGEVTATGTAISGDTAGSQNAAGSAATTATALGNGSAPPNSITSAIIQPSSTNSRQLYGPLASQVSSSSVLFPAAVFAATTEVTLQDGASLMSPVLARKLQESGGSNYRAAGPALLVNASPQPSAALGAPLTVQLELYPASSGAAGSATPVLVVVYETIDAASGVTLMGVIPSAQVSILGNRASFTSNNVGSFQAAFTDAAGDQAYVTPTNATPQSLVQQLSMVDWGVDYNFSVNQVTRDGVFLLNNQIDPSFECSAFVAQTQNSPFYDVEKPATGESAVNLFSTTASSQSIYLQYECDDASGNYTVSPWYGALFFAPMALTISGLPPVGTPSTEAQLYPVFSGLGAYKVRWNLLSGEAAAAGYCGVSDADYPAGWELVSSLQAVLQLNASGNFLLCAQSEDYFGNRSLPVQYGWSFAGSW